MNVTPPSTCRFKRLFVIFLTHLFALSHLNHAYAQAIVEPIGTHVQTWNPVLVNQYLAKWDSNIIPGVTDPFDNRYPVSEVQPTAPMYFVRVFTQPNSGPLGSYLVRAQFIRGLTPAQIRNVLALPDVPVGIVYVKVPGSPKYGLWTGIAGPILSPGHEWGEGGAQQTKIIGKETNPNPPPDPARFADYSRLPADSYMNATLIGNHALSYSQVVKSGNAGRIASYLDRFIPAAYSDMEMVYTTLDFANYDAIGTSRFAKTLERLSPDMFDATSIITFRSDLLFANAVLEHQLMTWREPTPTPCDKDSKHVLPNPCQQAWFNVSGEQGLQTNGNNRVGFYYQSGGLMSGTDCLINPNLMLGGVAAYLRSHVGMDNHRGNGDLNQLKLGIYANYVTADYLLNASLTSGVNWGTYHRHIQIEGIGYAVLTEMPVDALVVDRNATSDPLGGNIGLHLTGARHFQLGAWYLRPIVDLSYFYAHQSSFTEHNADSLNWHVSSFGAQTLRSQLSLVLGHTKIVKEDGVVKSSILLGWAHNVILDQRRIPAYLAALGGQVTVYGYHENTDAVLLNAGLSTNLANLSRRLWIDARYQADLSHTFNTQTGFLTFKYYFDL